MVSYRLVKMGIIWRLGKLILSLQRKSASTVWQFSWLEYLPVTQGVAGSSPVHTANEESIAKAVLSFCMDAYHILITLDAIYFEYIVASHSH